MVATVEREASAPRADGGRAPPALPALPALPAPWGLSGPAYPSRSGSPRRVHAFALPDVCTPCARPADRETNDNCYGPMTYYAYKLIQEGSG